MPKASFIRNCLIAIAMGISPAVPAAMEAQIVKPLSRFEIGADFVNPSTFSHWAQAPLFAIDSFWTAQGHIFLRDLDTIGITLANIHVLGINSTWPRNLINLMDSTGIRVSLHDDSLMAASRWERRYFEVEDEWDFSTRTGWLLAQKQDGYMTDSLRFDLHPRNRLTTNPNLSNGIRFQDAFDAGKIIHGFQHRDSLFINGRYYLTIRMGIPFNYDVAPNNTENPCLLLRMRTDSITMEWRVPGSAFYRNDTLRSGVMEYLPRTETGEQATFVLRAHIVDDRIFPHVVHYQIVPESADNWSRNGGHFDARLDFPDVYPDKFLPYDSTLGDNNYEVELEYLGPGDIFVDAICFSDPQGYGFFVGDEHALPRFRGGALRDSVHAILTNLGVTNAQNNNLAFLELQEAGPGLGCLTSMNLITRMIDEMTGLSDTIHTFNYGHPSGNMDRLAQENYNMVSGIYWYTNQQSLHSPEDPRYYSEAYNHLGSSFWYASRAVLRPFALSSKGVSGAVPFKWMPAVGIASYSFHNAFPWTRPGEMPGDTATEEVREPTAAELRAQVNLYLAYGAKSIMYYHYSSIEPNFVRDGFPYVPRDSNGLFMNRGAMGLVNVDGQPRTLDVWNQNKFDSTRHLNVDYLKSMGDTLFPLLWENAVTWDDNFAPQKTDEYVADVISERLNLFIDREDSTFVEVGRFSSTSEQNAVYLFVVNKRVDTLGQRHITVKLKPAALDTPYCRVQNVFTREEWIVQPHGDTTSNRTGGFTDYLPAGGGALYKLTPFVCGGDGNPLAGCRDHHLHIAKGTDISVAGDSLLFTNYKNLFIEGRLNATNVYFGPCSGIWDGIMVRDSGKFYTNPSSQGTCIVDRAPIKGASNATLDLKNTTIHDTPLGLEASACVLSTDGVVMYNVDTLGYSFPLGSVVTLRHDSVSLTRSSAIPNHGLRTYGGYIRMHGVRILHYDTTITIESGVLEGVGGDSTWNGYNRLLADRVGISVLGNSEIDIGYIGTHNSINKPQDSGYHVVFSSSGGVMEADSNYWSGTANPPWVIDPPGYKDFVTNGIWCSSDPVPFSSGGKEKFTDDRKNLVQSVTPEQIFNQYRRAIKHGDTLNFLPRLIAFVKSDSSLVLSTAYIPWLNRLAWRTGSEELAQGILDMCDNRSDLYAKLFASDLLGMFGRHEDALKVLNSYGFGADPELLKLALIRKSLLHPFTAMIGYTYGLACIDSLRDRYPTDFLVRRFAETYPLLYSGLRQGEMLQYRKVSKKEIKYPVPGSIVLHQNFPNPAHGMSAITFQLPRDMTVRLELYDALGRLVRTLADRSYNVGTHTVYVKTAEIPSGVYFYRLAGVEEGQVKKMVVFR